MSRESTKRYSEEGFFMSSAQLIRACDATALPFDDKWHHLAKRKRCMLSVTMQGLLCHFPAAFTPFVVVACLAVVHIAKRSTI
jgi:hypothetical protein